MPSLINKQNNKLLNLKLLKNKIYRLNSKKKFSEIKTTIKTNLKLLFKYQMLNKTILFLGGNERLNTLFFKLTKSLKHLFVPQSIWFKSVLTNSETLFKHIMLSKKLITQIKRLATIKQKVNLVLLFKKNFNKNELGFLKIPLVSFVGFNKLCDYYFNFFKKSFYSNLLVYFLKVLKKKAQFFKLAFQS